MRITLRTKLTAIMLVSAIAMVVIIVTGNIISTRVSAQLVAIRDRFLPRLELGPELRTRFEKVRLGLQNSVSSQDLDALAETRQQADQFLSRLSTARPFLDPGVTEALQSDFEHYYRVASDLSRRLIGGETGEAVVESMAAMQSRQKQVAERLEAATAFDQKALSAAFGLAGAALATGSRVRMLTSLVCLLLVVLFILWLSRELVRSTTELVTGFHRFGKGDFARPIRVLSQDEIGDAANRANEMADSLKRLSAERDDNDWLKAGVAGLHNELRGELELEEVANRAVSFLAGYLKAPAGALYCATADSVLELTGAHARGSVAGAQPARFKFGEGLVGQAAVGRELVVITDVPADYLKIGSGLGEASASILVLVPLTRLGSVTGVIELAFFAAPSRLMLDLLRLAAENVAIAIEVARARAATRVLLAETRKQAARLSEQEQELRANNEELTAQQEELRQTNDELAEQAGVLEAQRRTLEASNSELDQARRRLEQKAGELATVSDYKSQFLTNMSHELRTPLNSMLLLSDLLAENRSGNLTDKQVEFARTVHSSGRDLLALINQVLDLAKIEAGKQDLTIQAAPPSRFVDYARRTFGPMARQKGLSFKAEAAPDLPENIQTDPQRLEQILNNLLGNAIKFTERGEVSLSIVRSPDATANRVDFVVTDSGPGIAQEHQERAFQPFEQVDTGSDRRHGGTGLGLAISRELAEVLGGHLGLHSRPGAGSTFTLSLPLMGPPVEKAEAKPNRERAPTHSNGAPVARPVESPRARDDERAPETYLLIVEDDPVFAKLLAGVVEEMGLQCRVAPTGGEGLQMARARHPSGIILDVKLPDVDGFRVMEALRADPDTAAIPVHFVSAVDAPERGISLGAVGYLTKPASRQQLNDMIRALKTRDLGRGSKVLLLEHDVVFAESMRDVLAKENLETRRVTSADEALAAIAGESFACVVLDLSWPDLDALGFLKTLENQKGLGKPSILVHTDRPLTKPEVQALQAYTDAIVLKEGDAAERIMHEIRLFARRLGVGTVRSRSPVPSLHPVDVDLEGRKVLVVDDDMRTVFALSALLRARGMEVVVADAGGVALQMLDADPDIELVLMDIMMPEMDGYETMRRIRAVPRLQRLPIVALTAKAMKGEKEKCIEAGASDYLSKPIDGPSLLRKMQTFLPKENRDATRG